MARSRRMDLNLYLGLPRSPRPPSRDLGSDLALSSLPLLSSAAEETHTPTADAMSGAPPPSDSRAVYSPSHSSDHSDPLPVDGSPSYSPSSEPDGTRYPFCPTLEHTLYSPSTGPDGPRYPNSPTVQEAPESVALNEPSIATHDPVTPPALADAPLATGDGSHTPYSPSDPLVSTILQGRDEVDFGPYLQIPMQGGRFSARGDGSSSQQEFLGDPEFRFRRWIESNRRLQLRRFRSSRLYAGEWSSTFAHYLPTADQLMRDIMSSPRVLEATRKRRGHTEGTAADGSEGEQEEKSSSAASFECNICLDMAKDPVVTSCGHLFCWPCLYQWLHLHCDHSECPVCKGQVFEAKITPIYGRGSSETAAEEKCREDSDLGLKIPPRPRGHRFESWRQQLQRPISRRLGEGISTSWSSILDEEMHDGVEGHRDSSLHSLFDGARHVVLNTLMRERRIQRTGGHTESGSGSGGIGLLRNNRADPQTNTTSSLLPDEIDHWRRPSLYGLASTDRLTAVSNDLGTVVGSGSSQAGASTSSANHHDPEPLLSRPLVETTLAADQASASSTMAVIQGDIPVDDAPYSAGSSRSLRRRGRSSTSSSLDVDGGELHARKRRRLN